MNHRLTQLIARIMLVVMSGIVVSPSFAQSLVQTHAQLEHPHADGSNSALEQHLLNIALSHDHHDDDHDLDDIHSKINDDDHHEVTPHDDTDANGNDLPPHHHDNAHNFIGHIFGHMPVLFLTEFSFHFPPLSQMTQAALVTRPSLVIQDAPFRPPRAIFI